MIRQAIAIVLIALSPTAWAQQPAPLFQRAPAEPASAYPPAPTGSAPGFPPPPVGSTPLYPQPPDAPAGSLPSPSLSGVERQKLPAAPIGGDKPAGPSLAPPETPPPAVAPATADRVFCEQPVSIRLADPLSVPERYRPLVGVWSDAAWTPQLCAALIVENVSGDGAATITYAFGPIGSGNRAPGGVLHGTGIVRDGVLLFQNNDGSQYAFKPFYADLSGHLTTPQGQSYDAVFKKTY